MVRTAALAMTLALAACGPVAEESDNPGQPPTPKPSTAAGAIQAGARPAAFAQCAVCHQVDPGRNGLGPSLAGVFGANAAHIPDFAYSPAMRRSGLTWDAATLDRFLAAPLETVPGTRMSYAGLKDPAQRQAIIAYLKTL